MTSPDRTYRLLIVDDDPVAQRLYAALLGQPAAGAFDMFQATSGSRGLAALREREFDCILLDFELPDMTGLEFMTHTADADGEQPCAVILVTGKGNPAVAVSAMKHGARDYLTKDRVGVASLWRAITQAVTQTELRRRLAALSRERTLANAALQREVAAHQETVIALRTAKEAAEQASQAKTRFVAMVTHELRTPLNGVLGYTELLHMEGNLTARQLGWLNAATRAGRHLRDMIESVLDFASIEAGRLELHPAAMSVEALIEDCVAIIRPTAADRALNLSVSIAPGTPRRIGADLARMRQILINLLGNAIKFTRTGSVALRVLTGARPNELRIEVADTGPGIDPAHQARLFQDFERLNASATTEGTGLGLAITARIVALLGGTIVYEANPGGGSIFRLDLPIGDPGPEPPPEIPHASQPEPPCHLNVLLVDDVPMNLDMIGAFLRAAGHVVTTADGGADAVRFASETLFDVILMDIHMPEPNGLEATRRIRLLPAPYGEVPILALTAQSFAEQQTDWREAGMTGHVTKPVDYATLRRVIADAVAPAATDRQATSRPMDTYAPPRMDRSTLEETLAYLPPGEIAGHFRLLRGHLEQIARLPRPPEDTSLLREAAHALASTAGMFGFQALSLAARQLENGLTRDGSKPELLAERLLTETRAALVILGRLVAETTKEMA